MLAKPNKVIEPVFLISDFSFHQVEQTFRCQSRSYLPYPLSLPRFLLDAQCNQSMRIQRDQA